MPDKLAVKSPLKSYSLLEMCQNLFWFGTQKSPSAAWSAAPKEGCSSCLRNFMGFGHLLEKHPGDCPSFNKANIHRPEPYLRSCWELLPMFCVKHLSSLISVLLFLHSFFCLLSSLTSSAVSICISILNSVIKYIYYQDNVSIPRLH